MMEAGTNTMGDGDGDGSPGDGDGTPGDGDGTPGDGDGTPGDGDGTPGDGDGDGTGGECLDLDQDGYGDNCPMGPDCNDADYYNHTVDGCANCADSDMDGYWVNCDQYDDNQPGEDCDDSNFNVFTPDGCANCRDDDMDNVWVGCDQYGDQMPGPDCDDSNPVVGLQDVQEICNGLAENCAGEIDNQPPDDMCPPMGVVSPNVAPMNGWGCDPPAPGQDGCYIVNCVEQYFDLNQDYNDGCECAGTSRTVSLAACSDFPQGYLGALGEADQFNNLPVGTIPQLDNGVGNGREDWYSFDADEFDAMGTRPNNGSIQVSFAVNQGTDYRFEVYRSCNGVAFANSLATQYGNGAPPVREWWFFDNHDAPLQMPDPSKYQNNVTWPNKVYVRVFRVQNDNTCNNYQLSILRQTN